MTEIFHMFGFDVMGDLAFGKQFDMLRTGKEHHAIAMTRTGIRILGHLIHVPWLFIFMYSIPGLTKKYAQLFAWAKKQLQLRLEVLLPAKRRS